MHIFVKKTQIFENHDVRKERERERERETERERERQTEGGR